MIIISIITVPIIVLKIVIIVIAFLRYHLRSFRIEILKCLSHSITFIIRAVNVHVSCHLPLAHLCFDKKEGETFQQDIPSLSLMPFPKTQNKNPAIICRVFTWRQSGHATSFPGSSLYWERGWRPCWCPLTKERRPYWCPQIELGSYANFFFCFCWKTSSLITWVKTL